MRLRLTQEISQGRSQLRTGNHVGESGQWDEEHTPLSKPVEVYVTGRVLSHKADQSSDLMSNTVMRKAHSWMRLEIPLGRHSSRTGAVHWKETSLLWYSQIRSHAEIRALHLVLPPTPDHWYVSLFCFPTHSWCVAALAYSFACLFYYWRQRIMDLSVHLQKMALNHTLVSKPNYWTTKIPRDGCSIANSMFWSSNGDGMEILDLWESLLSH